MSGYIVHTKEKNRVYVWIQTSIFEAMKRQVIPMAWRCSFWMALQESRNRS